MSAPRVDLRTLLALAWPVVLARATQAVIGFSDALMVGPLGQDALTATTTGAINCFTAIILPMGTVFIVQSFVSQLVGRGLAATTRRFAWYGLIVSLVAGVIAVAGLPLVRPVLGWFAHDPVVESLMGDYMVIRLTAVGAVVGAETLGNWYAGHGDTRMQMRAGVLTMVANLIGNWFLIEGHAGAPALGVDGAALASSLASWIGFAYLGACFALGRGDAPRASGPTRLSRGELGRVLRFGLPNGLNWFLEFAAFAVFLNVVVTDLGKTTLGALNVIIAVNSVAFMPAFGVATAGAILAGQTIGAGQPDRVWPIVRLTLVATAVWMVAVGLTYLAMPATVVGWFAHDDPRSGVDAATLVAVGAPMLALSAAWQLFDAAAMTLSETLRAAGDTTWCLLARVALAWLGFVPASLAVVFVLDGGALAIVLCIIGYMAALAALFGARFRSGGWRRIDLTGREPALIA